MILDPSTILLMQENELTIQINQTVESALTEVQHPTPYILMQQILLSKTLTTWIQRPHYR